MFGFFFFLIVLEHTQLFNSYSNFLEYFFVVAGTLTVISRVVPISGLFYIRYPAGYMVSFAGYPVSFARYPAGYRISGRISCSNIHEIVEIVSNGNYNVKFENIEIIQRNKRRKNYKENITLKKKNFKPDMWYPARPDIRYLARPDIRYPARPDIRYPARPDIRYPTRPDIRYPGGPDIRYPAKSVSGTTLVISGYLDYYCWNPD